MQPDTQKFCAQLGSFVLLFAGLFYWPVTTYQQLTYNTPDSTLNPWVYGQVWGAMLDMLIGSFGILVALRITAGLYYRFIKPDALRLGPLYSLLLMLGTIGGVMITGQVYYRLQVDNVVNLSSLYATFWDPYVTYGPGNLAALLFGIYGFRFLHRHRPTLDELLLKTPLKIFIVEIDTSAKQTTIGDPTIDAETVRALSGGNPLPGGSTDPLALAKDGVVLVRSGASKGTAIRVAPVQERSA